MSVYGSRCWTTAANSTGTVTIAHDNRSRVSSVTDVFGQAVSYAYDANSNRTRLSLNAATSATYQHDVINRLTQLTDAASLNTTFVYDVIDKLTSRTLPNGVVTTSQYDGLDRLTRLTHAKSGSTLADFQYQFNVVSSITQMIDSAGVNNYSYDAVDRLTAATHPNQANESYTYDGVGNRTGSHLSASYSYQPFNRQTSTSSATYSYDNNGNLTSKTVTGGTWQYLWDYENRLKQVTPPVGVSVFYKYDALGRRIQRATAVSLPPAPPVIVSTTNFVYDGVDVVRDLDASGATTTDYLNDSDIDNKLRQTTGGIASYFVTDHLGTTRALADASGSVSSSLSYDSFGNVSSGSASTRYTYTGREFDADTGLVYYRARWYDPYEGRFISEDPIEFEGGVNWYTYVHNDPLNLIDPFGLQDGPRNALRNPCPTENWLCNGVSNSISDLLGLDRVAELAWDIGDHGRPTKERVKDALELAGGTALDVAGGVVLGKVCKVGVKLLKRGRARQGLVHPRKYFGGKTAQQANDALRSKLGPARSSRPGADTCYKPRSGRSLNVHTDPRHGPPHVDVRRRGGHSERKYPLRGI